MAALLLQGLPPGFKSSNDGKLPLVGVTQAFGRVQICVWRLVWQHTPEVTS
jgi:hypothetical protein